LHHQPAQHPFAFSSAQATFRAMDTAVRDLVASLPPALAALPRHVLVDGPHLPHGLKAGVAGVPPPPTEGGEGAGAVAAPPQATVTSAAPVIGGDATVFSIAAASIVAKVTRDRLMHAHHAAFPLYGFNEHKGYGTPAHIAAITEHGPCAIHRRTFAPLKTLYPVPGLTDRPKPRKGKSTSAPAAAPSPAVGASGSSGSTRRRKVTARGGKRAKMERSDSEEEDEEDEEEEEEDSSDEDFDHRRSRPRRSGSGRGGRVGAKRARS